MLLNSSGARIVVGFFTRIQITKITTFQMSSRPLSDDEVQSEMKKMVAFIKQEAIEKAREIQVKADEEFNIEKAKLVRQETIALEAQYEKKVKQEEISRKM